MPLPSFPFIYADPFSGASGDMFLGALVDLGYPFPRLQADIAALGMEGLALGRRRVMRAGISAVRVTVRTPAGQPHRGRRTIRAILRRARMAPEIRRQSMDVFDAIIEAEAGIHRIPVEKVHLHEVGALDALADVVGTVSALHGMGVSSIISAPVNVGSGSVSCAHGRLPVPAPATATLLKGIPQYGEGSGERTTPTGAALLRVLVERFAPRPAFTAEATGYGAARANPSDSPNVLRLTGGTLTAAAAVHSASATAVELRCQLDDMDPRLFGHLSTCLLEAGALDVYLSPVQMKKGRPGTLLVVLCQEISAGSLGQILLQETPTLGYRLHRVERVERPRHHENVSTPWGAVRIKVSLAGDLEPVATPEYEDCRRLARRHGVPLRRVLATAQAAWVQGRKKKR